MGERGGEHKPPEYVPPSARLGILASCVESPWLGTASDASNSLRGPDLGLSSRWLMGRRSLPPSATRTDRT